MRISDWSSDVCSSDLYSDAIWYLTQMRRWGQIAVDKPDQWYFDTAKTVYRPDLYLAAASKLVDAGVIPSGSVPETDGYRGEQGGFIDDIRSEEHTSELQSLMRISYAVFCLKKKKIKNKTHI